jgi:hypothetical protein
MWSILDPVEGGKISNPVGIPFAVCRGGAIGLCPYLIDPSVAIKSLSLVSNVRRSGWGSPHAQIENLARTFALSENPHRRWVYDFS